MARRSQLAVAMTRHDELPTTTNRTASSTSSPKCPAPSPTTAMRRARTAPCARLAAQAGDARRDGRGRRLPSPCRSGSRSAEAAKDLAGEGFKVRNLRSGAQDRVDQGRPLVSGAGQVGTVPEPEPPPETTSGHAPEAARLRRGGLRRQGAPRTGRLQVATSRTGHASSTMRRMSSRRQKSARPATTPGSCRARPWLGPKSVASLPQEDFRDPPRTSPARNQKNLSRIEPQPCAEARASDPQLTPLGLA